MKFNNKTKKKAIKKVDAWLDHSITRRDYANMFAVALGVYALSAAAVLAWYKLEEAKAEKNYKEETSKILEKMDYDDNDEEVDI